jgi:secondary thiamine-phosphate synthase enzyme
VKANVVTERVTVSTRGDGQLVDVTPQVSDLVSRHRLAEGHALVFVPGATAAVTTVEFEPGLAQDLPEFCERVAPRDHPYHHEKTWHDGNGHSHVRASLLGPSLAAPVEDGQLLLGQWQQIVLIDFDVRPRRRQLVIQLSGLFESEEG